MAKKNGATKLQPGDGAKIRRDARRMRAEKVYTKWTAKGYRRQQVAAAMAWNSGALAGRANDG
ncbi:MAG: hypothetical protein Q7S02_06695 [bacterium]|nr:hypothetical protein [bacterium]